MPFISTILKPTYSLLTPAFRKQSAWIVFLMVVQAALDFINIGVFIPLLALIAKPDFISSMSWMPFELAKQSPERLIIFFAITILVFTIIKHVVIWIITNAKARYAYQIAHHVSMRILNEKFSMSYDVFASSDYSLEMDRIANKPLAFANNIVIGITTLVSEGLIGLLIIVGITIFNFQLLLSLLLVLLPVGFIYLLSRERIRQISRTIKSKYPQSLKQALQAMEGWMEIKTYQREKYFSERFRNVSRNLTDTFASDHTLQIFSSRLTELFASVIICAIVLWTAYVRNDYEQTLILLAVYVGASFRLMPSINRILNALIHIKSHEYLIEELKPPSAKLIYLSGSLSPIFFKHDLALESISFLYPDRAKLFENLNFKISKGEKVAITGKSGGGKTSLALVLLGILRPTGGRILLDNKPIEDLKDYQSLFSFVAQSPHLLDASLKENIAFGIPEKEIDSNRVMECLRQVDLGDLLDHLASGIETQIGEHGVMLSGGQRQRLALARALYADRQILVLDEVTNQLDKDTEAEVIHTLKKITNLNRTLIMVTHHDQLLPFFDRVVMLENGKLTEVVKEAAQ